MISLRTYAAVALPLALAGAALTASPALAQGGSHGGAGVRASGACSGSSVWTLKGKPDNGKLEIQLEIDGKAGQTWSWALTDDGVAVAKGISRTAGPSGSFSATRRIADRPGTDVVRLQASRPGGETCKGVLRV